MRTMEIKKAFVVKMKNTGYVYPVIEVQVKESDREFTGYLTLFRERGFQVSRTIEGEWDIVSHYFPEDPAENHLSSKMEWFEWLDDKGHESYEAVKDRWTITNINESKQIIYDFCRAGWVVYANEHNKGKRVSEEDFQWYTLDIEHVII